MKLNFTMVITLMWAVVLSMMWMVIVNGMSINESKAAVREGTKECILKVGAEPADLENMFDDSTSTKSKCLRNCMMRQYKVIAEDGSLSRDGVINLAKHLSDGSDENAGVASEIVDICGAIKESDPCEAAHKYGMCLKNEVKTRGINLAFI